MTRNSHERLVAHVISKVLLVALTLILPFTPFGLSSADAATIYGLKSASDSPSSSPTSLFSFEDSGANFTVIGGVTLGGSPVDVDGFGISRAIGSRAYKITDPDSPTVASALMSINLSNGVATAIGAALSNREIRGAAFGLDDQFWGVDSANDELLSIDPATGGIVGTPLALSLGGSPFDLHSICDIAFRLDGLCVLVDSAPVPASPANIYAVNLTTGELTLLASDSGPQADPVAEGNPPGPAGAAFSHEVANALLFVYDVGGDEDIYTYDPPSSYNRLTVFSDIISSFNAGRGDLATVVPEPASVALFIVALVPWIGRRHHKRDVR